MYWVNKAIDKRIQNYGKGVGTMQYNPLLVEMECNQNDKQMTRRILENGIWYSGIEQDIQYFYLREAPKFYRKGMPSESLNYFWATNNNDIRKIHSGFPQLMCEKMVDLVIGNGYEIKVEGDNEADLQEDLDAILKDNKFKSMLLGKSIETESWSGGVAWKISWNPNISDYPIIEAWQPENYTNTIISGRVQEDIFYIYYDKGNEKYRLSEIYGVDKVGAYIDYKLELLAFGSATQTTEKPKWVTAPFTDLEQTKDLKRVSFAGYDKRLSLYKPNKLPNSEFRYSQIGESDYAGSYGAFDAVDEIISTWIQEFRDGKLNRYFPEELVPKNKSGDSLIPDDFKRNHVIISDSPMESVDKQKILYAQGDLRVEKHIESYKVWVTQILNNAGLSPLTVGVTGLESIDSSAESQQEREKVSIRTRNKKAELWAEFLQDYLKTVLEFYLMMKNVKQNDDETYSVNSIPEFDIIVSFNDYIIKSKSDRTIEVQAGIGSSWDILSGVQYVHTDKTEREQLALSARIKLENGINSISTAEISALQAENLDVVEALQDDGVEIIEQEAVQEDTEEPEAEIEEVVEEEDIE